MIGHQPRAIARPQLHDKTGEATGRDTQRGAERTRLGTRTGRRDKETNLRTRVSKYSRSMVTALPLPLDDAMLPARRTENTRWVSEGKEKKECTR